MSGLRLVVGLGNPGPGYAKTRHNAGFMLLDLISEDASWKSWPDGLVLKTSMSGLVLAKPMTFMNDSGRFAAELARFYKISPAEILICFDDMSIPLGRIRLRAKGSAGGHNGMRSVIEALGTSEVPRLRLGVGPKPAHVAADSFVLASFTTEERKTLGAMMGSAREAVSCAVRDGLEAAMLHYNGSEEKPSGPPKAGEIGA